MQLLPYNHIRSSAQSMVTNFVTRLQCNKCCTQLIKDWPEESRPRLLAASRVYQLITCYDP